MSLPNMQPTVEPYTAMHQGSHSLHECRDAEEFRAQFLSSAGCPVEQTVGKVVRSEIPQAVFLVGSLPLGMATSGSDIDLIVLVDDKAARVDQGATIANTEQNLVFSNDTDMLRVGEYLSVIKGIVVDVAVAIAPSIVRVYTRLRSRGPELSESEIMVLGRLRTGWLLWETPGYLAQRHLRLTDTALDVYCSTKSYVSSLHLLQKSCKALEGQDIPLALQLGRSAIQDAYLAYFASEGLCYLGPKWLAQVGHSRDAAARVSRHPLLKEAVRFLFPLYPATPGEAHDYLQAVARLLTSLRTVIEEKPLFRIAFKTCPQIRDL